LRTRIIALLGVPLLVLAGAAAPAHAEDPDRAGCAWTQWGHDASHAGVSCAAGQRGLRLLDRITVDPFAAQEIAESQGLPVHYPVPLIDRDGTVFVMQKGGTYVSCDPPGSGQPFPCGPAAADRQIWMLRALRWQDGKLVPRWTFTSDWKPFPAVFEAMFQSAMDERFVYVPGAGGTVFQLDKHTGRAVGRINPFGTSIDPATYVSGGLTLDAHDTLYYNIVRREPSAAGTDTHSWLVQVPAGGRIRMVDYRTLIPSAPKPTDLCYGRFSDAVPQPARPWPPPPQPDGSPTLPPQFPCLSQRAAINVAPAIGPDGTVFTVTRASNTPAVNDAFLVAVWSDLRLKWAASLRGRLDDGCGVLTPYGTGPRDCRPGAARGVDPSTNLPPAGQAHDASSASPTVLPDGGVLYGAYTSYNGVRGHLMRFDRTGAFTGAYDFGWDITPAVYRHDHTYSILDKDNNYFTGGPYRVTSLDAGLHVQWQYTNTSTKTCHREPDGGITCVDDGTHPNGFEWCISAPAVDRTGATYGISEDGNLYVLDKDGQELERVFLGQTLQAAYTPVSIDSAGRIYAQNNGDLYAVGH
jgi:hypothetical protein